MGKIGCSYCTVNVNYSSLLAAVTENVSAYVCQNQTVVPQLWISVLYL